MSEQSNKSYEKPTVRSIDTASLLRAFGPAAASTYGPDSGPPSGP